MKNTNGYSIYMISNILVVDQKHFNVNNHRQLKNLFKAATRIIFASEFQMNDKQKDMFMDYPFDCLLALDLNRQNVDDNFIKQLCDSDKLKTIRSLDLRNNPEITTHAFEYLTTHDKVGCYSYYGCRLSGKYGQPIVEISVDIDSHHDISNIDSKVFDFDMMELISGQTYSGIKNVIFVKVIGNVC
jgi:hypothetical protein